MRESELEFIKQEIEQAKEKFAGAPLGEAEREKAKEIEEGAFSFELMRITNHA